MLIERIETAKNDNAELERLIAEYLPFIKKTVNDAGDLGMEYDDRLSLAMLSFMNSVKQYQANRGNFLAFAAACIRNRLIDESRKQIKHSGKVIPLLTTDKDGQTDEKALTRASIEAFDQKQEQENLTYELDAFSQQLGKYNISFKDLPQICPKQARARTQCIELGRFVANNAEMLKNLLIQHRLAQSELAKKFELSEKTIEKHRKYIVTIVIILTGEYPFIRAFLPQYKEV